MNKYQVLKYYFGYDSFREGQEQLIDTLLSGRDVLGVMPTGAGKSICYQVPALLFPGITLIISPLISLMIDQVRALNKAGVHAAYINSSLTERQIELALGYAMQGVYKIIYVAPERLLTRRFLDFALHAPIDLITVDEAHCISHWGQDFRPSYLQIAEFVRQLPRRPVIGAFTATATERVREDIENSLQLEDPRRLVTGFDRSNLYFSVKKYSPREKDLFVVSYLREHEEESGIIYCSTRKNVDKLSALLNNCGFSAVSYHAGLSPEERLKNQEDFVYDRIPIVVATNAFGMGIDKSNVRFVLHYNMPQSLENYYQEAGRGGRDGEDSECILLYTAQDIIINRLLIQGKGNSDTLYQDEQRLQQMIEYCSTSGCLRNYLLSYFGEKGSKECDNCSNCLGEQTEDVSWVELYQKKDKKKKSRKRSILPQYRALFERLKKLRADFAEGEGVPPYIIFTDRTLTEICEKAENIETTEDLLSISGIGAVKLERYGAAFFEIIHRYKEEVKGKTTEDFEEQIPVEEQANKRRVKIAFSVTREQIDAFPYEEDLLYTEFAARFSEIRDRSLMKKISGAEIFRRLMEEGYAKESEDPKCFDKIVTVKGLKKGLYTAPRTTRGGTVYQDLYLTPRAQRFCAGMFEKET